MQLLFYLFVIWIKLLTCLKKMLYFMLLLSSYSHEIPVVAKVTVGGIGSNFYYVVKHFFSSLVAWLTCLRSLGG